jgi:hypothetical protein
MEFEVYAIIGVGTIAPLIDIRIPPFLSYFLCRSIYHLTEEDPCCLVEQRVCSSTSLYNITIRILIGLISGPGSAVFLSAFWGPFHMVMYEVFPSLAFFKHCLLRINELITNTDLRTFNAILLKYRELQLLSHVFNNTYQIGVFAVYVAAAIGVIILSGSFMLIVYRESIPMFLCAAVINLTCYFLIGTFITFASHVWTTSDKIQISWKQNPRLMKNPISRRTRLSVRNMKIKIGSCNFIERMTPLVIISFCVEQTVTVVLLRN